VLAALHDGPRSASEFDARILSTLISDHLVEVSDGTASLPT
jgi:hypothetical protein